ncbi:MAG: hypothetical protein GWN00_17820, partial [Aliifodinibius sp.]|nr:site-specific integrase [Fodinibius sp.]NIV12918.1 hypothetical protein [Fodinibius sp.]NIY26592.1 hypothetical protein [Fodinibius sp.]
MQHIVQDYKSYLETDCRYPYDTVRNYLATLPSIFHNLQISSVRDINVQKVAHAWKYSRWKPIHKGIQLSDANQDGYLPALKEFLKYLEDNGYPVQRGISDIIRVTGPQNLKLKGLASAEQKKLKDFLVFHVNSDIQRRDTVLAWLLMETGCTVNEALALNVHTDGIIYYDPQHSYSGDFEVIDGQVFVHIRGIGKQSRKLLLSPQMATFLNFYLENRSQRSSILFVNNNSITGGSKSGNGRPGKHIAKRLTPSAAENIIEKIFTKAGIKVRPGRMTEVLRYTAKTGRREEPQDRHLPSTVVPQISRFPSRKQSSAERENNFAKPYHKNVA